MEMNFGALIFDDPADPQAGWAAQASKKAVRISDTSQLPTDTIWWTNVSYSTFWRGTEVWRNPNLKHDKYLVIAPLDVLKEWARDPQYFSNDFVAELASKAFARIMRMAWNLVRDVDPKARLSETFVGKTLREDIRCLLPDLDYPKGEAAMVIKRGSAWEEFTTTTAKSRKGSKMIRLRRPRVPYAIEMLQSPVPRGPFEFVARKDMTGSNDKTRWAIDNDRPLMVEIKVNRMQPEISPIYGFGNAIDRSQRIPRSWVAHPEFIAMTRYADVEVRNAWSGSEYWAMFPEFPEVVRDFLLDTYTSVSWSAGVLAETLWRAVALGEDKQSHIPNDERAMISWPGAWVKSVDKTSMFEVALQLHERQYAVKSYGLGWITCAVPEQDMEQYIRDGLSLGLLPNLLDIETGRFGVNDISWGGDDKTKPLARFSLIRNDDLLWKLDQIPLLPTKSDRDNMVKTILQQSKGGGRAAA